MFDLGWSELLVIGIVALIVVGPKDLPGMFRTLGRFTAKAKNMAREFQRAMDDAADDAGLKETARDLKDLTNPGKMGLDAVKDAADKFEKWEPKIPTTPKGPATAELSEARKEASKTIKQEAAKKTSAKPAAKPAAKKPAAKKPAAKKPAARKPAAKPASTAVAKKPAAKKPAARKPAAAKPAAAKKPAPKAAPGTSDA